MCAVKHYISQANVQNLLVTLAHEAADPSKGDDGEDAGLGLWTHLAPVHKLPICQHLQSDCRLSVLSKFAKVVFQNLKELHPCYNCPVFLQHQD